MTRRQEQIESVIKKALAECISRGLNDPRIRGMVSVTSVNVAADLTQADVRISVLPEEAGSDCLAGLRSASGYIRKDIGRRIPGRGLPRLHFILDNSLKREMAVIQEIDQAVGTADENDYREGESPEPTSPSTAHSTEEEPS